MNKSQSRRVGWIALAAIAPIALGVGVLLANRANRRSELVLGPGRMTEVARVATGHQRADRVAFADQGKLLAVTCPRYNRVVLYRITDSETLELVKDVALEGQPMAVWATEDRLFLLQRPPGESRHLEPG